MLGVSRERSGSELTRERIREEVPVREEDGVRVGEWLGEE